MLDLCTHVVGLAEGRSAYAEARHVVVDEERLAVADGRIDDADAVTSEGLGIRVRVGGGWGFAATREVSRAGAEAALQRALSIAEAQPPAGGGRPLTPVEPARGHWSSAWEVDPFGVALEEKLALLVAAEAALREGGDARLVRTVAESSARRERKAFASTEGAACTQETVSCGGGLTAYAAGDGELQIRSFPLAHGGDVRAAGWEHVRALDLAAHAPQVAAEAVELLTAPPLPAGARTIVLHPEQAALQIHESIGHALELDRILLGEASYAGTSFVRPEDLGSLRYGSELLTITADARLPGGLGTFGWDDEGVPAQTTTLIDAGVLRGALTNREGAAALGLDEPGGCARAEGWARQPIVRMTNVSIEPGTAGSLQDLIADTDDGVYFETNRSWSIDDRRLQFQFVTQLAREIRGGELRGVYRNPSYAGITPQFWGRLDAVGSADAWRLWGLTNCGKGEPGQVMAVSHGAAPLRLRDIQVGVA